MTETKTAVITGGTSKRAVCYFSDAFADEVQNGHARESQ
jgi:hypothetical protein